MATTTKERSRSRAGGRPGASGNDRNTTAADRKFLERHGDGLSKTTHRAKWIHTPDEEPDRNGQTLATRDHDVIRAWAEERRGTPVTASRGPGGRPRVLRFDFEQNGRDERLEPIGWDEWFSVFDDRDLVFLYQERRRDGSQSNFFRLDSPKREEG